MRPILLLVLVTAAFAAAAPDVSVTASELGGKPVLIVRGPAGGQLDPAAAARLRLPVSVHWDEVDTVEALDQLARLTGAPIVVGPTLRAGGGVPITLQVETMRADRVLKWITTLSRVQVTPLNGGLYLSLEAPALPQTVTIVDVGDLVHPIRDFPGPELSVPQPGGEGAQIFGDFALGDDDEQRMDADELAEMVEEHLRR